MKVFTDTHSLVWGLGDPSKLSDKAVKTLSNEQVIASVVNLWELILRKDKASALLKEPVPFGGKSMLFERAFRYWQSGWRI